MDFLFARFSPDKLKPYLKMAVHRFGILTNKKTNLIKQDKREIAELLRNGKEEKARIKVEHVIRQDFTIEAYEILELLCELVHERMRLIAHEQDCPADLKEAICTLIWSAQRTECPELTEVAKQFKLKYGKEFYERAMANWPLCVNDRVLHKLSIHPPTAYLIQQYLLRIAQEYQVDWTPTEVGLPEDEASTMPAPSGFSVPVAGGSGIVDPYYSAGSGGGGDGGRGGGGDKDNGGGGDGGGGIPTLEAFAVNPRPPPAYSPPGVSAVPVSGPAASESVVGNVGTPAADIPEVTVISATPQEPPPAIESQVPPAPTIPQPPASAPAAPVEEEHPVLPNLPSVPGMSGPGQAAAGGGGGSAGSLEEDMAARLERLTAPHGGHGGGSGDNGGGAVGLPPAAPGAESAPGKPSSDYEDLMARFNQLKS